MVTKKLFVITLVCIFSSHLVFITVADAKIKSQGMSKEEVIENWQAFQANQHSLKPGAHFPFMKIFEDASKKYTISLPLLIAVAMGESDFQIRAKSDAGCHGIMQIKYPSTANDLGVTDKEKLYDPEVNIHAGAAYLSQLIDKYEDDLFRAVVAYNYGPNAISKKGSIPDGATWYAGYIYEKLQVVLSGRYQKANKLLVFEFSTYNQAKKYLIKWGDRLKIPFIILKSSHYTYDLYITHETSEEREKFAALFQESTGLSPLGLETIKPL